MNSRLKILTEKMDWDVREQCERRNKALDHQYRYLLETQNEYLMRTLQNGWFSEKYYTLFSFNSFFQIVIGPLASSTRGTSNLGLGSSIPISYGNSIKFNSDRNALINKMYSDFILLIEGMGFKDWWLIQNKASDIIYQIAKDLEVDGKK